MKPALPLCLLALAACGESTDYNDAASNDAGVNALADAHLLEADRRGREEAIATGALPATATASYACADGSRFEARFDNAAGTATLTWAGGAPLTLHQRPAASGIWYAGDGVTLRGKGREATLARDGRPDLECTASE